MTPVEQATKIVVDLENELEALNGRAAALTKTRDQLSYAAKTGDQKAKAKLDKTNAEATTIATEIEITISALQEAKNRLGAAEVDAELVADQAKAVQIQELQQAFIDRLELIGEACEDIIKCTQENKVLLSEMHRLGVGSPSHDLLRINCIAALKTMLQGCPWNVQEFQNYPHFLAPHERKYFKKLAESWDEAIENQIAHRLPKKEAA
jgi:hypothetical protein